jgi:predicted Zn-dependent protease
MHPADPQTEFLMAREYLALGEHASALEYATLSSLHDASPVRAVACAPIVAGAGAPQRAARLLESVLPAITDQTVRIIVLRELAMARSVAGDHDGSLVAAHELVATAPGAASQAILGDALLRAGRLADAEDAFSAGTSADPRSTVCWNGLGTAALNRWIAGGRVDQSARARAVAAFEASLAIDAEQPKVVRLMASHGL